MRGYIDRVATYHTEVGLVVRCLGAISLGMGLCPLFWGKHFALSL